jgi:DNA replication protein DnaC
MGDVVDVQVTTGDGAADYALDEGRAEGAKRLAAQLPRRYANATVTNPAVAGWVRDVVAEAVKDMRNGYPVVRSGPSLVLTGNPGRGKTWQVFGALRMLSGSGVFCQWRFVTASDMFAELQPRHGVDSEDVFEEFAGAGLLVIDDLGASKDSAWKEDTLGRVIDRRSKWMRPTLITTNFPGKLFTERFGERIASRLDEMATVVPFLGPDLRRGA